MSVAALPAAVRGVLVAGSKTHGAVEPETYTRFERARIIGARALQISLGAPILTDIPAGLIDPVEIAEIEFAASAIPISVRRGASS